MMKIKELSDKEALKLYSKVWKQNFKNYRLFIILFFTSWLAIPIMFLSYSYIIEEKSSTFSIFIFIMIELLLGVLNYNSFKKCIDIERQFFYLQTKKSQISYQQD